MNDLLSQILHWTTRAIEVAGIVVIVAGTVVAGLRYLSEWRQAELVPSAYHRLRSSLGRSILLGLELLVAADIINTVAIEPTLESLAVLGGIVLIRTFLSLSLEVEIEGRWPWQQARGKDAPGKGRENPR
ncbi:Uncharacterized membrane protein [Devosia crocina]|uniref:Uncharacterized membrane protein n=1 Tax=Devosia crocina TaxID=429728 RepID=A0A1I7NQF3_9HYPH|nr:DUF1622 domain-containing protein [Devosia crocina]SFV36917.1 Uncharacterized membrane protein [Devosia crocina]